MNREPNFNSFFRPFEEYLSRRDRRMTAHRKMIARLAFAWGGPFTAEDLHVRFLSFANARRLTIATVYRTLGEFVDAGILRMKNTRCGLTYWVPGSIS